MEVIVLSLCSLLAVVQTTASTKVETTFDKSVNFQALRTYTWLRGYDAHHPEAHKHIVAALEEEMARLGFTKVAERGDVTLSYYTVMAAELDLKALDALERSGQGTAGSAPMKPVGRLLVIMRWPDTADRLWSASTRENVDVDMAKLPATLRVVTRRLFETYPGKKPRR